MPKRQTLFGAGRAVIPAIETANLVAWFKADGITGKSNDDTITTWFDQSGKGNDASESTNPPTYKTYIQNGLPVVRFDGGSDRLTISGFGTTEFSSITEMTTFVVYNPRGDTQYNVLDIGTTGQHWRFAGDGGMYNSYFKSGRSVNDPPGQPVDSNFHYQTLRSGPVGAYDIWLDGVGGSEYAQGWGVASDDLIIGNGGDAGGINGDIAEIIIYARELSDAGVLKIESYLSNKWT